MSKAIFSIIMLTYAIGESGNGLDNSIIITFSPGDNSLGVISLIATSFPSTKIETILALESTKSFAKRTLGQYFNAKYMDGITN